MWSVLGFVGTSSVLRVVPCVEGLVCVGGAGFPLDLLGSLSLFLRRVCSFVTDFT